VARPSMGRGVIRGGRHGRSEVFPLLVEEAHRAQLAPAVPGQRLPRCETEALPETPNQIGALILCHDRPGAVRGDRELPATRSRSAIRGVLRRESLGFANPLLGSKA
jgi:hypothetical protein